MNPALVCIPTYNERENVESIVRGGARRRPARGHPGRGRQQPRRHGEIADELAARGPARAASSTGRRRRGWDARTWHAFDWALQRATGTSSRWTRTSATTRATCPRFIDARPRPARIWCWAAATSPAAARVNWGLGRQIISRGGSLYARTILGRADPRPHRRLQVLPPPGAARPSTSTTVREHRLRASRSSSPTARSRRASRVREVPIVFEDRRVGQSKMSGKIFLEALAMVWKLRSGVAMARVSSPRSWCRSPAIFFVVDPIGVVPIFLAMTGGGLAGRRSAAPRARLPWSRRRCCCSSRSSARFIFKVFGVSLGAFRVAGGILLLITALDMLRARPSETRTSPEEAQEGAEKEDVAIVPLAMPLLAGPGAIATVMVLMSRASGVVSVVAVVASHRRSPSRASYFLLRGASLVQRVLGQSGVAILQRVMGFLLAAIAVQFIAEGGRDSGRARPTSELTPGASGRRSRRASGRACPHPSCGRRSPSRPSRAASAGSCRWSAARRSGPS